MVDYYIYLIFTYSNFCKLMIEFLSNTDILWFAEKAWSSAIMVVMIFWLMYMLNRSQKKYLESMDKYSLLLEKQIQTSTELTLILKNQNEQIKEIFNSLKK